MAKSSQTKYVNVMLQNARNMEKIPLMDIKVESTTDQPTCHSEIINQECSVIADIIKNIMYSLDLLIKSDPDNVRSANVRDKIIAVLFTYQDYVDVKDLNMASYTEVDIFDNSNYLKEIDIVYKEDNNSDDLNMSGDDSFNDNNMEDSVNSNVRKKENTSGKYIRVEAKEKKRCVKPKPRKKIKKKASKRTLDLYEEIDIFDNSTNLNDIDIVYNDSDDDDSYKPSDDSDIDDSIEKFLSSIKNKVTKVSTHIKKVKDNRKTQSKKCKPTKKMTRVSKNSEIVNIDDDSNTLRDVDIVYNEDSDSVDSNLSIDIDEGDSYKLSDDESYNNIEDEIITDLSENEVNLMKDNTTVKQKATSGKQETANSLKEAAAASQKGKINGEEMMSVDEEVSLNYLTYKSSEDNIGFVSAVPRYVCDICDITVISEHHLTVHKHLCKMRHYYYGNPLLEEYWNDLKCPLCDVVCLYRNSLTRHFITHRVLDIQSALFESCKDKKYNRSKPEDNMKVFDDFIAELKNKEKIEKTINIVPALIQHSGNIDSAIQESSDTNHEKAELRVISKKSSIDDYVQFNVKKIVYDVDINKKLYCSPCDILFNTKDELEEHRKKLNNTDVFVCNHCDKTFDILTKVIKHIKSHEGLYNPKSLCLNNKLEETEGCPRQIDYRIYVCKYCLAIYTQEGSLQTHYKNNIKYGSCPERRVPEPRDERRGPKVRARRTKNTPGLKQNAVRKFQCDQCDKSYAIYHCFKEHLASHSEIFKYQCECGKGFKSKARLKFHVDYVHAKKYRVMCDICGIELSRFNFKRHMNVHSDLKAYMCDYCNKSFRFKEGLIAHIRTHTHERPWKCKYCEMTFSELRNYKIHMNIHEGKTPYKCDQCPSGFVSRMELRKHLSEHTDCRNSL